MSDGRKMCPRCYGGGSVVKIVRREGWARREFWPCAVCDGEGIIYETPPSPPEAEHP